jgi:hypothetical protein
LIKALYLFGKEKWCEATKAESSDDTRRSTYSREVGYIYKEIDCKVLQEIKPFKGTLPRDLLLPVVFSQPPTANADVSPISDWAPILNLNIYDMIRIFTYSYLAAFATELSYTVTAHI